MTLIALSSRGPSVRRMLAILATALLAAAPGPHVDNPYMPLKPGTHHVFRETDAQGHRTRDVVRITHRTKRVAAGIVGRVVRDTSTRRGVVQEDTFDYYAQDAKGNVWYMGEDTTAYENGKPASKAGSWEAGVDGAEPGIVMLAHPRVGRRYREENYPGHALDGAQVMSRGEQAEVPYGHFKHVLFTKNFNPLEPRALEYKFYARGIGPVLEVGISGDDDRSDLLRVRRGNG
jgi:hypothetical protein